MALGTEALTLAVVWAAAAAAAAPQVATQVGSRWPPLAGFSSDEGFAAAAGDANGALLAGHCSGAVNRSATPPAGVDVLLADAASGVGATPNTATSMGTAGDDEALGLALMYSTLIVAGRTDGAWPPAAAGAGGTDAFALCVSRYDLSSYKAAQFGGRGDDAALAATWLPMTAWTQPAVVAGRFGNDSATSPLGGADAFLAVINNTSKCRIAQTVVLGSAGDDEAAAVASVGGSRWGVVAGRVGGAFVNATVNGTWLGGADAFLAVFAGDTMQIAQGTQFGGPGDEWAAAVAAQPTPYRGNVTVVAVAGVASAPFAMPTQGAYVGGADVFVASFFCGDAPLALRWVVMVGSAGDDVAAAAVVRCSPTGSASLSDCEVYVAGSTNGALGGAVNHGGFDAFLLRLSLTRGDALFVRLVGSPADDWGLALAVPLYSGVNARSKPVLLAGATAGRVSASAAGLYQPGFRDAVALLWDCPDAFAANDSLACCDEYSSRATLPDAFAAQCVPCRVPTREPCNGSYVPFEFCPAGTFNSPGTSPACAQSCCSCGANGSCVLCPDDDPHSVNTGAVCDQMACDRGYHVYSPRTARHAGECRPCAPLWLMLLAAGVALAAVGVFVFKLQSTSQRYLVFVRLCITSVQLVALLVALQSAWPSFFNRALQFFNHLGIDEGALSIKCYATSWNPYDRFMVTLWTSSLLVAIMAVLAAVGRARAREVLRAAQAAPPRDEASLAAALERADAAAAFALACGRSLSFICTTSATVWSLQSVAVLRCGPDGTLLEDPTTDCFDLHNMTAALAAVICVPMLFYFFGYVAVLVSERRLAALRALAPLLGARELEGLTRLTDGEADAVLLFLTRNRNVLLHIAADLRGEAPWFEPLSLIARLLMAVALSFIGPPYNFKILIVFPGAFALALAALAWRKRPYLRVYTRVELSRCPSLAARLSRSDLANAALVGTWVEFCIFLGLAAALIFSPGLADTPRRVVAALVLATRSVLALLQLVPVFCFALGYWHEVVLAGGGSGEDDGSVAAAAAPRKSDKVGGDADAFREPLLPVVGDEASPALASESPQSPPSPPPPPPLLSPPADAELDGYLSHALQHGQDAHEHTRCVWCCMACCSRRCCDRLVVHPLLLMAAFVPGVTCVWLALGGDTSLGINLVLFLCVLTIGSLMGSALGIRLYSAFVFLWRAKPLPHRAAASSVQEPPPLHALLAASGVARDSPLHRALTSFCDAVASAPTYEARGEPHLAQQCLDAASGASEELVERLERRRQLLALAGRVREAEATRQLMRCVAAMAMRKLL